METGMIVIFIILLLVCTLPFILITRNTKKREKQLKAALIAKISKNNGALLEFEINNNAIIGLDNKNQLYYYSNTQEQEHLQSINLNDVKSCKVVKDTKRVKSGKSEYELAQRIALIFSFQRDGITEKFEIYNNDDSSQLDGEIALAEKWEQKVTALLSKKRTSFETGKTKQVTVALG
ncbi:hypothetical protein ULMS_13160 [Patiriisocius marinistellae]|uniref:Uncharacterized protein n=1 Tax=Patiriisocius marinistellae TaxID=2494560 RepID=A0A5J4FWX3_9FLAO|nr:hypothetical protein [Patiriisocius marinistellae]GEQ85808.1 hypothetical protein ULMS_13160 [Patiriisocius marinistellae]